jgi:hypothetical protein
MVVNRIIIRKTCLDDLGADRRFLQPHFNPLGCLPATRELRHAHLGPITQPW